MAARSSTLLATIVDCEPMREAKSFRRDMHMLTTAAEAGVWGAAGSNSFTCHKGGRPARVLLVGDDQVMSRTVASLFEMHDMRMSVVPVSGWQGAAGQLAVDKPCLVILDVGEGGGLDLLREIQSRFDVPVIITGGHSSDEADRVIGLELGADDYVTRPFGSRELLARVRAVLRRRRDGATPHDPGRGRSRFGGWELDRRNRRLSDPHGNPVALTKGEYALLTAFLDAPQRPLTREYLLQATRVHEDIFDRSIDVQILRLRRKLEVDPSVARVIETERGVGYSFVLPVERL